MVDKKSLTAYCGLDCFNCELYKDNLTDRLARVIAEKMGVKVQDVPCPGCRRMEGVHFHLTGKGCDNFNCARKKGVELCSDCDEFPCALLAPLADQASRYPHNMKLYNLCRIKLIGLDRWIEEEAGEIRKRYFNHPFVVGKGQAD